MKTLFSLLPSDLQGVIKQVNKTAFSGNQSYELITSIDKLFLLATVELTGNYSSSHENEGVQYEYWETRTDNADRIKKLGGTGNNYSWWFRTPSGNNNQRFTNVSSTGLITQRPATEYNGVSFAFCI